ISRRRASGVAALPMPIMPSPPAAVTAAASAPPATPPIGALTTGTRRPKARDHGVASGSAGRMSVVSRAVGTALCQHSAEPARRPAPRPSENVAQDTNDGSLSAIVHCQSNRSTGHRRRHPDRGRVVPGQATAVRSPDRTFPARSTMYPGAHVDTFPDKPALIMAGSGETLTYRELEDNSVRLARHLHEAGLRRGDHLALLSGNDPKVYEVYWAALRSGLYITAVNRHLSPAEIAYIVDDCGAKALIVAADLSEAAQAVAEQTPKVRVRIAYGGAVPGHDSYEQALAASSAVPLDDQPRGADMLYSSGTTGRPKGIKHPLPERQVGDAPGDTYTAIFGPMYGFDTETVYLSPAPLYHAAPLRFGGVVQALGGTVVVMEKFDAENALAAIEKFSVTHSQWVPTMFVRMLKLDEDVRARYDVSSLKVAVHAAAPCPTEVKRAMIDWWGPVLYEYYASTEGNGVTFIDSEQWLRKPGSVGRSGLGVIRICGEDGAELPVGEIGTVYF